MQVGLCEGLLGKKVGMGDLEEAGAQSLVFLRQSCQRCHQSFKFRVHREVYRLKTVLKDTFLI
jgi:hypothetical protein